jgi:SAM-dependent methyltransferase
MVDLVCLLDGEHSYLPRLSKRIAGDPGAEDPVTLDRERTAQYWASSWDASLGLHWTDLAAVQRRLNCKVSGDGAEDWLSYSLRQHFSGRLPLTRCYSLGCGCGAVERRLAKLGAFVRCEASDISEGALIEARRAAMSEGIDNITYEVLDANALVLPAQTYDAIWAHASVHHLSQLEHVFSVVGSALKPEGLFILLEYIGPSRFQFPARQREIIQACHDLLPPHFRRLVPASVKQGLPIRMEGGPHWYLQRVIEKLREGDLIGAVARRLRLVYAARTGRDLLRHGPNLPTASSVKARDSSEAIRSAEIVPVLREHFRIVEFKPLGGSILQFLLADIAGNFQSEAGNQLLEMLFIIEDALMATGELDSDFAYIVATPLLRTRNDDSASLNG